MSRLGFTHGQDWETDDPPMPSMSQTVVVLLSTSVHADLRDASFLGLSHRWIVHWDQTRVLNAVSLPGDSAKFLQNCSQLFSSLQFDEFVFMLVTVAKIIKPLQRKWNNKIHKNNKNHVRQYSNYLQVSVDVHNICTIFSRLTFSSLHLLTFERFLASVSFLMT